MAVTSKSNVRIATADADVIPGPLCIKMIKFVAGASGATVNLKSDGVTGGTTLWSAVLTANAFITEYPDDWQVNEALGLYMNIAAGGGTLYLYLK